MRHNLELDSNFELQVHQSNVSDKQKIKLKKHQRVRILIIKVNSPQFFLQGIIKSILKAYLKNSILTFLISSK